MFRPMRRAAQALAPEDCLRLLETEKRGVLSLLGDEGYPYGVPLNHYYSREEGLLYFHGGLLGHRVDAFRRCDKASYCVFDRGVPRDGGWALDVRSVVVFGRLREVKDRDTLLNVTRLLSLKFTEDEEYIRRETEKFAAATLLLAMQPEQITGKLVNES